MTRLFNRGWWPHWLGESATPLTDVHALECRGLAIGYAHGRSARSGLAGGSPRTLPGGHGAPRALQPDGNAQRSLQRESDAHRSWLHDGLELRFEAGLVHGVLGENGSGKSCLIKTLAGLVKPIAGDVSLRHGNTRAFLKLAQNARAALPMAKRSAWQGYLQQEAQVHWDLPVRDVVKLGASARRDWSRAQRAVAAEKAMAACDCLSLAARSVLQLSTGERQRVMLARVMAAQPKVLLVDEPTAGLDPRHQHGIMQLLREVAQSGVIVITVMHDIELTRRYCDTALLLDRSLCSASAAGNACKDRSQCLNFASDAGDACKDRSQCLNFASGAGDACKDQALGANVACKDQAPGAGFAQGPVEEVLTVEAVRRVFGIG